MVFVFLQTTSARGNIPPAKKHEPLRQNTQAPAKKQTTFSLQSTLLQNGERLGAKPAALRRFANDFGAVHRGPCKTAGARNPNNYCLDGRRAAVALSHRPPAGGCTASAPCYTGT